MKLASRSRSRTAAVNVSERLARWLVDQGVQWVFGVSGGGVAPLWSALARTKGLRVVHTQHEAGAAFCATEASLATGRPVAVFLTTGPGVTNAMTGLVAARREGARVIALSGVTALERRFRGATQESGPNSEFASLYGTQGWFDLAAVVESPATLPPLLQRIGAGLSGPRGYVAHLGLPTDLQSARDPGKAFGQVSDFQPEEVRPARDLVESLTRGPSLVVAGFEARDAIEEVRTTAEALGAPVVVTPRAKGVFPASHPLFAGVIGFAGSHGAEETIQRIAPADVLVLGSDLGEGAAHFSAALSHARRLVLVHPDEDAIGRFPSTPVTRVVSPVRPFLRGLLGALGPNGSASVPTLPPVPRTDSTAGPTRRRGSSSDRVSPIDLFDAIQRVVVDGSDAWLMAESGNSFAFAIHRLRLERPRLRVSVGWGSMGHFTTGVVGAALARDARVVSLVGDGAMLMLQELATAVRHDADATWIVLNDGGYGMCRQGMSLWGLDGVDCELASVDFAAWAKSLGMSAATVRRSDELDAALSHAITGRGPRLVDVRIDPSVPAPIARRVHALTWSADEGVLS